MEDKINYKNIFKFQKKKNSEICTEYSLAFYIINKMKTYFRGGNEATYFKDNGILTTSDSLKTINVTEVAIDTVR